MMDGYEALFEMASAIGAEAILDEVLCWLPTDTVDEIAKDVMRNLDYDMEFDEE